MTIKTEYPPNYNLLQEFLNPPAHAVFAYGDTIYNPSGKELAPDIIFHESIHGTQQNGDPESWYNRYVSDKDFRYSQELEAYGEQYAFAKNIGVRGKMLDWVLDSMANAFSTDYGFDITHNEARSKIRNFKS